MATTSKVIAKKRDRAGKGGARSSRRGGLIPAVIYGDKQPPMMIAVEPKSVEREMHKEGFFNHQLQIEVDGQGFDVLPRDVQAWNGGGRRHRLGLEPQRFEVMAAQAADVEG